MLGLSLGLPLGLLVGAVAEWAINGRRKRS